MTLDQIQALTDEEIRVRVAQASGWQMLDIPANPLPYWNDQRGVFVGGGTHQPLPNYPADLNACAEFASYLRNRNRIQYGQYARVLSNLVGRLNSLPEHQAYHGIFDCDADARTRCEAFLAVMGDFAR